SSSSTTISRAPSGAARSRSSTWPRGGSAPRALAIPRRASSARSASPSSGCGSTAASASSWCARGGGRREGGASAAAAASEPGEPGGRGPAGRLDHDLVIGEELPARPPPARHRDRVVDLRLHLGAARGREPGLEVEQVLGRRHADLVPLLLVAQVLLRELARDARRVDPLAARDQVGDRLAHLEG